MTHKDSQTFAGIDDFGTNVLVDTSVFTPRRPTARKPLNTLANVVHRSKKLHQFISYALLYGIGQMNLVLPVTFTVHISLTDANYSFFTSLFFLVYGLLQVPVGLLADRFGSKRSVSILYVSLIIGTFLMRISDSFLLLCIGRSLTGLGSGCVFVAASRSIAMIFEPSSIPLLTSIFIGFSSIGILFTTSILPQLTYTFVDALFFVFILQIVAYFYFLAFSFEPNLSPPPTETPTEEISDEEIFSDDDEDLSVRMVFIKTKEFFKTRNGTLLAVMAFSTYACWSTVAGLLINRQLSEVGYRKTTLTILSSMYCTSTFYSGQIVGYINKYFSSRSILAWMHLLGAIFLIMRMFLFEATILFAAVLFIEGFITGGIIVPVYADVALLATAKGTSIGCISTIGYGGAAVLQMITGSIMGLEYDLHTRYKIVFGLMAGTFIITYFLVIIFYEGTRGSLQFKKIIPVDTPLPAKKAIIPTSSAVILHSDSDSDQEDQC
ncbi:hypothetical protein PCE1_004104 [Barthelona sp. PCE]